MSWDVFGKHWASDAIVGMGGAAREEEEGGDAMSTRPCWAVLRDDCAVGAEVEVAMGPVFGGEGRGSAASAIVARVGCCSGSD